MTSMHMTTNFPIKCLCIKDFYKKLSYCYLASREVNLQNFDLEKQYARSILMIFLIAARIAKNLNIDEFYQCILQKYKIFYYILVYCYLASRNENLFEYDPEKKSVLSKKGSTSCAFSSARKSIKIDCLDRTREWIPSSKCLTLKNFLKIDFTEKKYPISFLKIGIFY